MRAPRVVCMEDDEGDRPHLQSVVLSQTCWEYKTLFNGDNNNRSSQSHHDQLAGDAASKTPKLPPPEERAGIASSRELRKDDQPQQKRAKTAAAAAPARNSFPITNLQTLRLAGTSEKDSRMWDILVLVLQTSGLQQITSKAGFYVDLCTLLVADPSSSFFRVTLWRRAATVGARLVHAGDLVRLNRIGVSTFRDTVQANSTQQTRFRVVWRGDAFTTHHDADSTTMLSQANRGRGGRRFQAGPILSQEDDLAVSREDACDLAAWAKSEFPSVTAAEACGRVLKGAGARAGSLGAVRKGVETTVRACVLKVSGVESLWTWESVGGQRRKDVVARATALLTDGPNEMILQLWGDLTSEDTLSSLRAGVVAVSGTTGGAAVRGLIKKPAVFEFARLRPEFSLSCEALVLNTMAGGIIRTLAPDSPDAVFLADAVVRASSAPEATLGEKQFFSDSPGKAQAEVDFPAEGGVASARRFASVAELMSTDGYSGACVLGGVVVRKVEAPGLGGDIHSRHHHEGARPPGSGRAQHVVCICLGDAGDSDASNTAGRCTGVEVVLRVVVDGGALRDLLGGIPEELLAPARGGGGGSIAGDVGHQAAGVLRSLLDGLEVGGEQGERVDVVLACLAAVDSNGLLIPGGTRYRLIQLCPRLR